MSFLGRLSNFGNLTGAARGRMRDGKSQMRFLFEAGAECNELLESRKCFFLLDSSLDGKTGRFKMF